MAVADAPSRSGAVALVESLEAAGGTHVFGNPGSTELELLDAIGRSSLDYVTCLHEAVAVGAAEGYARVSGRPGIVQLHTTAGLGNAMGMLANAAVGCTPLVVLVGAPARAAAHTEPILGGDPVAMAATVARWAWEVRTAEEIPTVVARAFKVAASPRPGPVVLVIPVDVAAEQCTRPTVAPSLVAAGVRPAAEALVEATTLLAGASSPALVIGDGVSAAGAGLEVAAVAELLGAPIYSAYLTEAVLPERHGLDAGPLPAFDAAAAAHALSPHDVLLAVGTPFLRVLSRDGASALPSGARLIHIGSDAWELGKNEQCLAVLGDERAALVELHAALATQVIEAQVVTERPAPPAPAPGWSADTALAELASVLPPEAILIDESVSAMPVVARRLPLRPGAWFRSRGGALGAGLTLPLGAAIAAPGRPIVAVVGDGSAMYAPAALWTAARRSQDVLFVILDNGGYGILDHAARTAELSPVGTRIAPPHLDFVGLAEAQGVTGYRLEGLAEAADTFRAALAGTPSLVHLVLDPERRN